MRGAGRADDKQNFFGSKRNNAEKIYSIAATFPNSLQATSPVSTESTALPQCLEGVRKGHKVSKVEPSVCSALLAWGLCSGVIV